MYTGDLPIQIVILRSYVGLPEGNPDKYDISISDGISFRSFEIHHHILNRITVSNVAMSNVQSPYIKSPHGVYKGRRVQNPSGMWESHMLHVWYSVNPEFINPSLFT